MIDLSLLNIGNLFASVLSGILAGLYLSVFHPTIVGVNVTRRALLQGWYFGFLGSILYIARIAFSVTRSETTDVPSDVPRVVAGWVLWLLFSVSLALGAWLGARLRRSRSL